MKKKERGHTLTYLSGKMPWGRQALVTTGSLDITGKDGICKHRLGIRKLPETRV